MSRTELVEFAAAKTDVSKAEVGRVLDALLEGIQTGLKKEGKVTLVGFGTFSAKKRAAREGINPLTKEAIKIPAKTVASFKAGKISFAMWKNANSTTQKPALPGRLPL